MLYQLSYPRGQGQSSAGAYPIPTWTRRRVETPESRRSPGLRARTKKTSAALCSGISLVGKNWIVAHPLLPVTTSGAARTQPYGTPIA